MGRRRCLFGQSHYYTLDLWSCDVNFVWVNLKCTRVILLHRPFDTVVFGMVLIVLPWSRQTLIERTLRRHHACASAVSTFQP